jgi:hypothetical protein
MSRRAIELPRGITTSPLPIPLWRGLGDLRRAHASGLNGAGIAANTHRPFSLPRVASRVQGPHTHECSGQPVRHRAGTSPFGSPQAWPHDSDGVRWAIGGPNFPLVWAPIREADKLSQDPAFRDHARARRLGFMEAHPAEPRNATSTTIPPQAHSARSSWVPPKRPMCRPKLHVHRNHEQRTWSQEQLSLRREGAWPRKPGQHRPRTRQNPNHSLPQPGILADLTMTPSCSMGYAKSAPSALSGHGRSATALH